MARPMLSIKFDNKGIGRELRRSAVKLTTGHQAIVKQTVAKVVPAAQSRASGLGGVHKHVAAGITTAGSDSIQLDVARHPAILGAEFGGRNRPTTQQFPPRKNDGYMLYPSVKEQEGAVDRATATLIEKAGP
jgi:hypothetical protein